MPYFHRVICVKFEHIYESENNTKIFSSRVTYLQYRLFEPCLSGCLFISLYRQIDAFLSQTVTISFYSLRVCLFRVTRLVHELSFWNYRL